MKIWKFGIIGAGMIADTHAQAILSLGNTGLIGFCDSGSGKAKTLAIKYSCKAFDNYHELLCDPDIDIVIIATPSGKHLEPAVEAAKHGKHVLCEKPLEITPERIDAMIAAHEKRGTFLGGIFNFRFNESLAPLKNAIESGRFGTLTYASVHVPWWRSDEYYKSNWRGTWKLDGGGALMNQGIHMVDLLQYLMGPVDSLQAFTATLGHATIEVEDTAVSILKFRNNALGFIYGTTASYPGQFRRLEITGTRGSVVMVENSITVWQFAEETAADTEIRKKYSAIEGGGGVSNPAAISFINHARNIEAFITAIEEKKKFEIDGQEARKAVEIICGIYRSAGEKQNII